MNPSQRTRAVIPGAAGGSRSRQGDQRPGSAAAFRETGTDPAAATARILATRDLAALVRARERTILLDPAAGPRCGVVVRVDLARGLAGAHAALVAGRAASALAQVEVVPAAILLALLQVRHDGRVRWREVSGGRISGRRVSGRRPGCGAG